MRIPPKRILTLPGAIWAKLVPTVIALGIYFCAADLILLAQVFYYRESQARKKEIRGREPFDANHSERSPLINSERPNGDTNGSPDTRRQSSVGLPGSQRRRSLENNRRNSSLSAGFVTPNPGEEDTHETRKNILTVLCIIVAGTAIWAFFYLSGSWTPVPKEGVQLPGDEVPFGAEVLGYLSAVAYLGYIECIDPGDHECADIKQCENSSNIQELHGEILRW